MCFAIPEYRTSGSFVFFAAGVSAFETSNNLICILICSTHEKFIDFDDEDLKDAKLFVHWESNVFSLPK